MSTGVWCPLDRCFRALGISIILHAQSPLDFDFSLSLSFPLAHGHLLNATVEFDGIIANISTTKYGT
jgi:hypothetical protein